MPDADKFSRYIRESANELEKLIKKKAIKKTPATTLKFESDSFFNALKRFLKRNPTTHTKHKGVYQINVKSGQKQATWFIDLTKKAAAWIFYRNF